MKTHLHLVAMPLAYPLHPSSQLGYLHGFIARELAGRVVVSSYSAFLDILSALEGASMVAFFERHSLSGEELLFLANCYGVRDALPGGSPAAGRFDELLARYNGYSESSANRSKQKLPRLSRAKIAALHDVMVAYLDEQLVPALRDDTLNVIGFTATFCQVFGSIFAARHLRRVSDKPMLFVFGGSSFSLPEGSRTLAAWGCDGVIVAGSGEVPLAQLLEACLDLAPSPAPDPVAFIAARQITNVTPVGQAPRPIDLRMAKSFLGTVPDPNYDEYFADLASHCEDEESLAYARERLVSIPLEGSRGCFAKCDFCHNTQITSEFRSLTGRQVAERAIAMTRRYQVQDVTFVDSVCNTWAEQYAEYLLAHGVELPSFMEMRVHAPEAFWTKLALSGLASVQFGVEAISDPLLTNMRKGTRVMQNLAATKYMAEMGLEVPSNLIINHPKSTVADVLETRRLIELAEHFPPFSLSHFVVSYASPLYDELPEERRQELHRGFDWLPAELVDCSWPRHLSYTYPPEWIEPGVVAAWDDFEAWYGAHLEAVRARAPRLQVTREGETLRVVDTRFGERREQILSGAMARAFDVCHQASDLERVAEKARLPLAEAQAALAELTARRLTVAVGDQWLSLALRPREELVANLERRQASRAARPRGLPVVRSA